LPKHRSVLWSAGNKNKQTTPQTINIHHLPSPVPHPHHHHHSPCQPPPTTFLQVLDHPHSKLGVGGQAPTPPSDLPSGWPETRVFKAKSGCGTGPPASRKPDTHNTSKHDSLTTPPSHTQSPFAYPTATDAASQRREIRLGARRSVVTGQSERPSDVQANLVSQKETPKPPIR
jgi:hypothetical protein